ncbi:MAG: SIMPL domain-containing protein [Anaerolineae bacterium]
MAAVEPATGEAQPLYRVSNMVNVTIRDLESVGDVLDAVVEAGANNIWGITFAVDDPSDALANARAGAIEDARARAGALAELSGVSLGPVMSVSEVVGATPVAMSVTVERAAAAGGSISPGELEIGYQAQVTYFIER